MAGPPVAAIVGEAPGPNTSPKLPLFPVPTTSAGGRLLQYSRLSPAQYLGRFVRFNVFSRLQPWSVPAARERAAEIIDRIHASRIRKVVLLGGKVAAAFGVPTDAYAVTFTVGAALIVVPHPSGLNRMYNDDRYQRRTGAAMRWAAGYRKTRP